MKVSDFCKEFGFEIIDGNLALIDDDDVPEQNQHTQVFKTVQRRHVMEHPPDTVNIPPAECLSQVQILRNHGSVDTFVRLTKNSNSYDLTKVKSEQLSAAEKVLIRGEITSIMKMLKDAMP